MKNESLRYRCEGEVHRDFHASILDGYNYVKDNYGEAAVRGVMRDFAQKVHRQMHEKLKAGDFSELVEYWKWYMNREGGEYSIKETDAGEIVLEVRRCPGCAHLERRGIAGGGGLCAATKLFNECLCEGTPFVIETETSGGGCSQVLKRK